MLFLSPKDWNCKQVEKNLHVNLNVNKCIEEIGLSISFNLLTSCFPSLILGHQLLPSADILYPRYLHSSLDTSFLLCRSILNLCQLRGRFEIILSENLKYYTMVLVTISADPAVLSDSHKMEEAKIKSGLMVMSKQPNVTFAIV